MSSRRPCQRLVIAPLVWPVRPAPGDGKLQYRIRQACRPNKLWGLSATLPSCPTHQADGTIIVKIKISTKKVMLINHGGCGREGWGMKKGMAWVLYFGIRGGVGEKGGGEEGDGRIFALD